MKIAMLGSGFIGRFYADSLQGYRSKDKIVTIYSRREESAKEICYKIMMCPSPLPR
jgi:predicted dinucleotide-utilizing enzyme